MIIPDVNVLVGAFRTDSPNHAELTDWLEDAVNGPEPLGLTQAVATGVIRILTYPRIFANPTSPRDALRLVTTLAAADGVTSVSPGPRHWEIFTRLCLDVGATGNLVPDAAHAATAIEHGATWVTLDRDFARFPSLRTLSPLR
jgi:toxin-antitoxin system PIN domain toxin